MSVLQPDDLKLESEGDHGTFYQVDKQKRPHACVTPRLLLSLTATGGKESVDAGNNSQGDGGRAFPGYCGLLSM